MSTSDVVRVERHDDGVVVLTLNRPEKLNAFNDELHDALPRVLDELDDDMGVRALVLTGAGRAFTAGGDRSGMGGEVDLTAKRHSFRVGRRLVESILGLHAPLIAAVNGPAVGLGATIATASDLVLMSEDAFLADTHVAVGLVAGDGGALTWPALTSLLRAKEYLLTGDRVPAGTAVELGLANRVCAPDALMTDALALAHKLAALPPQAVQDTKQLLNLHLRTSAAGVLGQGMAAETLSMALPEYGSAGDGFRREN